MTTAVFSMRGNEPCGVYVQGHSGYAALGEDIVCSAVSALTITTINEEMKRIFGKILNVSAF